MLNREQMSKNRAEKEARERQAKEKKLLEEQVCFLVVYLTTHSFDVKATQNLWRLCVRKNLAPMMELMARSRRDCFHEDSCAGSSGKSAQNEAVCSGISTAKTKPVLR